MQGYKDGDKDRKVDGRNEDDGRIERLKEGNERGNGGRVEEYKEYKEECKERNERVEGGCWTRRKGEKKGEGEGRKKRVEKSLEEEEEEVRREMKGRGMPGEGEAE